MLVAEAGRSTRSQAPTSLRRQVRDPGGDGASAAHANEGEAWLISYIDILTLLLVVFVFMVGQGPLGEVAAPGPAAGLQASEGPQRSKRKETPAEVPQPVDAPPPVGEPPGVQQSPDAQSAEQDMLAALAAAGVGTDVELTSRSGGFQLEIGETVLFDLGSADLTNEGRAILRSISAVLVAQDANISVEGHTDSVPISSRQFPTNWELSTQRATTVVRHLLAAGIPNARLKAVGYADTRPRESNATAQGRARNRRVDLVIDLVS